MILYQFNVAWMRQPFTDPVWDEFKELLAPVHMAAGLAPGFVERYLGEDEELGYIAPYPNKLIMGNLSGWRDAESLRAFTFSEPHATLIRRRREWFWQHFDDHNVLYWAESMDLEDAVQHLRHLRWYGPSERAFTWKEVGEYDERTEPSP